MDVLSIFFTHSWKERCPLRLDLQYTHVVRQQLSSWQRVLKNAENIINTHLPTLADIYASRCLRKALSIIKDSHHPAHELFELLPSGKRCRSIRAQTTRLMNSSYPKAISTLNSPLKSHTLKTQLCNIILPLSIFFSGCIC